MKPLCITTLITFICLSSFSLELDPNEFMTIDQIKPGMKGVGKTVFNGTKIEEFQIEVLEVAKNVLGPKQSIIWVLCSGGPLEETGVISGMSGSPVYIDGKLIGAIAYRMGSFQKRPIAGVTPIADMLKVLDNAEKSSISKEMDEMEFPFPIKAENLSKAEDGETSKQATIEPIQTPVMMSGFSSKTIDYIAPLLNSYGMVPVQGGGISTTIVEEQVKIEPGSVIGIEFVRGDASVFGSGTVTYVKDDKVLAFGHSLVGLGKTSLPISIGKISLLVPSLQSSVKYGSPIETIGTLINDNQYGIIGITSQKPEFIPVRVRVNSLNTGNTEEFNFEVAKHKIFAPIYIFSIVMDTINNAVKSIGDYTIIAHSEINIKNYPKVLRDNIFSGLSPDVVASDFASPLYSLMQNRFEELDIQNVLLDISFEERRTNAVIDDVRLNKLEVKPGDYVNVTVSITPYMQSTIIKQFDVAIPKDAPEGRCILRISDASSSRSWESTRAPQRFRISSVAQLIQLLNEEESNNDIVVELFCPKAGVVIRGEEFPALPLTAFSVMSSSKYVGGSSPTLGTTILKQRIKTDYVISGSASTILTIDRDAH